MIPPSASLSSFNTRQHCHGSRPPVFDSILSFPFFPLLVHTPPFARPLPGVVWQRTSLTFSVTLCLCPGGDGGSRPARSRHRVGVGGDHTQGLESSAEPREKESNFAEKNPGIPPGGGACSLGFLGGRHGAPPSSYFLPSARLERCDDKAEDSSPTPPGKENWAHAHSGETAEHRGAIPVNAGCQQGDAESLAVGRAAWLRCPDHSSTSWHSLAVA